MWRSLCRHQNLYMQSINSSSLPYAESRGQTAAIYIRIQLMKRASEKWIFFKKLIIVCSNVKDICKIGKKAGGKCALYTKYK